MTSAPEAAPTRAFVPFLDEIDGTLCLPASATPADLRARIGEHPLRFPLLLDEAATLEEHVTASGFAPASSRFGPYCDNILGMNWELPDGRLVRVGERVVKTTTGYDWMRFLLHSGHRFGRATDYVLRLRPDCGLTGTFALAGRPEFVRAAVPALLRTCWMHWFDAVDVIGSEDTSTLRVTVHCPAGEWNIFRDYLAAFAGEHHLGFAAQPDTALPADGCPDVVFKTSPDRVLALAADLVRAGGARWVALCSHGVVHGYLPDGADRVDRIRELARPHLAALDPLGGDWHSRHLPRPVTSPVEAAWIATLEEAMNRA